MNRTTSHTASFHRGTPARTVAVAIAPGRADARWKLFVMAVFAGASALAILSLSGCHQGPKTFGTINGQIVTEDEYVHILERQTVAMANGQQTNAERQVLDQIVTDHVVLTEASKNGVLPTDDDVNNLYRVQKELFTQQYPDKDYETVLKEQGQTPDQMHDQIRVQLATTALYAKELKLDESDVRAMYEKMRNVYSLPARVQLRVVIARDGSPDFAKAQQEFAANKPIEEIAKEVNLPQLRNSGGLLQQMMAINRLPPVLQTQVAQAATGATVGPIDFQKGFKAWVKVEKKYAEFKIPEEDAAPLVRRQLVQQKMADPANAQVRNQILQLKLDANFKTEDKSYETVWNALKEDAKKAGIGQTVTAPPPPPTAPMATGAAGAPPK